MKTPLGKKKTKLLEGDDDDKKDKAKKKQINDQKKINDQEKFVPQWTDPCCKVAAEAFYSTCKKMTSYKQMIDYRPIHS